MLTMSSCGVTQNSLCAAFYNCCFLQIFLNPSDLAATSKISPEKRFFRMRTKCDLKINETQNVNGSNRQSQAATDSNDRIRSCRRYPRPTVPDLGARPYTRGTRDFLFPFLLNLTHRLCRTVGANFATIRYHRSHFGRSRTSNTL